MVLAILMCRLWVFLSTEQTNFSYVISLNTSSTNRQFNRNYNLHSVSCQSAPTLQDVSVGEEDGYVMAGYGHHKGECRLLLRPTLLIYLIIRPSRWLKACGVATWPPTSLSDESFVLSYQTRNVWREFQEKKKILFVCQQQPFAFWSLRHFDSQREADAICETQVSAAPLPSHVQTGRPVMYSFKRQVLSTNSWFVSNNIIMSDLYLEALGFRGRNCTLNLCHRSVRLIRQGITKRSNSSPVFLLHWWSVPLLGLFVDSSRKLMQGCSSDFRNTKYTYNIHFFLPSWNWS